MNQTNIRYNLFRSIGVRTVLRELNRFDLGRRITDAVKEYHGQVSEIERIQLSEDEVWPVLAHGLAWRYFDEHDAIPVDLKRKIGRMMKKYRMNLEKACTAYAGRVYTDARAGLVLRDLRSRGRA